MTKPKDKPLPYFHLTDLTLDEIGEFEKLQMRWVKELEGQLALAKQNLEHIHKAFLRQDWN